MAEGFTAKERLRSLVAQRTVIEGRTDSVYPGLRYYRFSAPTHYRKVQVLIPGIVVVVQGSKRATLGGETLHYDTSNCLVLSGETICQGTVVTAKPTHPYLAIHLDLPPDTLVKALIALSPARGEPPAQTLKENFVSAVDAQVLDAMARLLEATDTELDRRTIAPLAVEEIVVRLLRSEAGAAMRDAAAVSRSATRIQQSMQFMRSSFHRPLSVNELADQAAMSPSHYAHSFREVAGVSPMRYLRDLRLDEARALLLRGDVRTSEAAARTGFESTAHFSREFKSRFDASPTAYVQRMKVSSGSQ